MRCDQLRKELSREKEVLKSVSKSQSRAATADAVGVFLVLVPAGSVFGGDKPGDVAVSKGKVLAMESELLSKSC